MPVGRVVCVCCLLPAACSLQPECSDDIQLHVKGGHIHTRIHTYIWTEASTLLCTHGRTSRDEGRTGAP